MRRVVITQDLYLIMEDIRNMEGQLITKEQLDEYVGLYLAKGTLGDYDEEEEIFYSDEGRETSLPPGTWKLLPERIRHLRRRR